MVIICGLQFMAGFRIPVAPFLRELRGDQQIADFPLMWFPWRAFHGTDHLTPKCCRTHPSFLRVARDTPEAAGGRPALDALIGTALILP